MNRSQWIVLRVEMQLCVCVLGIITAAELHVNPFMLMFFFFLWVSASPLPDRFAARFNLCKNKQTTKNNNKKNPITFHI